MDKELKKLLAEIDAITKAHEGKRMEQAVADELDGKATEALALQTEIKKVAERGRTLEGLKKFSAELDVVTDAGMPPESKGRSNENAIVGYISAGSLVAGSKGLRQFIDAGMPKNAFKLANIPSMVKNRKSGLFIPLTGAMVAELKAVPTIGDDVIQPTQLAEIIRDEEHRQLTLRDVLSVGRTASNAVRYSRMTYTRNAGTVAMGAAKPQSTMAISSEIATVKKIAVWMPVHDEQLADMPELGRLINEELLFDVDLELEEQVFWGSGVGEDFDGLCLDPDIPTARFVSGDTLIDTARRMITDVRVARYVPNAICVHPLDWETIVLEKGSDNRYVWVVVTENGVQRLWGVPVVETVAVEDNAGVSTEERQMICGDFIRGATLWDREDASIQVGWQDKQFIENTRTILAELRAAFAVRRPSAFVKYETAEASAS